MPHRTPHWLNAQDCRVAELDDIAQTPTRAADYPLASGVERGVLLYNCPQLRQQRQASPDPSLFEQALQAEWTHAWQDGPGVVVLQGALPDASVVDAVTEQFQAMIDAARAQGAVGDHFAKPGANDRVWNALEKLCVASPEAFATYYGNDMLALASRAWLGPAYQITSQVNCVNPGGEAQLPHRDYHLGFFNAAQAQAYPAHVHRMSSALTLQGAVAHVDMPLESGPTLFLPHSQKYLGGYLLADLSAFRQYFDEHHVQLPLRKGDAVFFNPALLHAAGHNRSSDIRRMGNLLQVSSAFGRAMESVDRTRMSCALYPALLRLRAQGTLNRDQIDSAIASCAEGYAFPTNLDRDPPLGGLAPMSQQTLMRQALQEEWPAERFEAALLAQAAKKLTH